MKRLLTAAALALLTTSAHANDWTKEELSAGLKREEWSKYVGSGNKLKLSFVYAAKPDCSSVGTIVVRTLQSPEHGTFDTEVVEDFPTFKQDNKLAKCNDSKMPGTVMYYKSNDDYVGPDSFKVLVIYPTGLAYEVRYKMIVR
ncbi:hypothetical protein Q2941_18580 [Bradyrhizobium sp. UFLA05-153]